MAFFVMNVEKSLGLLRLFILCLSLRTSRSSACGTPSPSARRDILGSFWSASMGQIVFFGRVQAREDDVVVAPLEPNHKIQQAQIRLNGSEFPAD